MQGLSHEEMLIEASSAFIGAAERFDVSKNARLTSYAWFSVMSALQQLCQNEGALLPMTTAASRELLRLSQAESQLRQKTGMDPTIAETAAQVSNCMQHSDRFVSCAWMKRVSPRQCMRESGTLVLSWVTEVSACYCVIGMS